MDMVIIVVELGDSDVVFLPYVGEEVFHVLAYLISDNFVSVFCDEDKVIVQLVHAVVAFV